MINLGITNAFLTIYVFKDVVFKHRHETRVYKTLRVFPTRTCQGGGPLDPRTLRVQDCTCYAG